MTHEISVDAPAGMSGRVLGRIGGAWHWTRRFAHRKPLGAIGALLIILVAAMSLGAPLLAPYDYREIDARNALDGMTLTHLAGTDGVGRDTFSRTLFGGRTSLTIGFGAVIVAVLVSATIGVISGYARGRVDLVLQRFVDAFQAVPAIVLLLMIATVFGNTIPSLILIIGVISGVSSSRIVRGATLSLREQDFVFAAQSLGASRSRLMLRHIVPNLFAPLMIIASLALGGAILTEAAISFLGFGIQPPTPSWGTLLGIDARLDMVRQPGLIIAPGLMLSLVVFGVNVLGDALRDELDPRLRSA